MKITCLMFYTLYAFYAFCTYKKHLSESCFLCFLYFWVKVACLRFFMLFMFFVLFVRIKIIWAKVAYLRLVLFVVFMRVKSFCKKNKTTLIPSFIILLISSITKIFFNHHNIFQSSQYFSIITIFVIHY